MSESFDVSIVITSFNYAHYVKDCIESCLKQVNTTLKFEVIVVDDGSTDDTQRVIDKIEHPLLKKKRIANSGIESASNHGFKNTSGKYIVRVDADDKLAENYLSQMEKHLATGYDFYYPNYFQINESAEIIKAVTLPRFDQQEILQRGDFLATGTLFSREMLLSIGGYSTSDRNSGLENFEFIICAILAGFKGKNVSDFLFFYRRHSSNISLLKKDKIVENGYKLFRKLQLGEFRTNENHPYGLKL